MLIALDLSSMTWQLLGLLYAGGLVIAIVRCYRDQLPMDDKVVRRFFILAWGFIILIIPLGWILYLITPKNDA